MKSFTGQALRWEWRDGVIELTLDRPPANEIGTVMLGEPAESVEGAQKLAAETAACIVSSAQKSGFSAGADLRELYQRSAELEPKLRAEGVREFLENIHTVLNWLDEAPFVTIAAV